MSTPRPLRLDEIAPIVTELHRDVAWLATPCGCPNNGCRTMAEHMHRVTAEGRRGIPAASLEPSRASAYASLGLPTFDSADRAHGDYLAALRQLKAAGDALARVLDSWRPDRYGTTAADPDQWCRHHLDTLAVCEPIYRAGLCRWCYDFNAEHRRVPTAEILAARHRGERITQAMVADALRATARPKQRRKRRK